MLDVHYGVGRLSLRGHQNTPLYCVSGQQSACTAALREVLKPHLHRNDVILCRRGGGKGPARFESIVSCSAYVPIRTTTLRDVMNVLMGWNSMLYVRSSRRKHIANN